MFDTEQQQQRTDAAPEGEAVECVVVALRQACPEALHVARTLPERMFVDQPAQEIPYRDFVRPAASRPAEAA